MTLTPVRLLAQVLVSLALPLALSAQHQFTQQELRIPWVKATPSGLDALLVYANVPAKRPIVVLTHGTSRELEAREKVSAWSLLPEAMWFAERGWEALVVVRRGYGLSGGEPDYHRSRYSNPRYYDRALESAEDLRRAIQFARELPGVDPTRVIAAGQSTGGLAVIALTADAPEGLIAAINFAGGRGSHADFNITNPGELIDAFRRLGKRSRIPMLWLYAENDHYFWPEMSRKFDEAFRKEGGQDQFLLTPAVGDDGHSLFRRPAAWTPYVESFLKTQNLVLLPEPLPPPDVSAVPAPPGLSESAEKAFRSYLRLGPHKAFAVSSTGYGLSAAQFSTDEAKKKAVENCRKSDTSKDCRVVFVDGERP